MSPLCSCFSRQLRIIHRNLTLFWYYYMQRAGVRRTEKART